MQVLRRINRSQILCFVTGTILSLLLFAASSTNAHAAAQMAAPVASSVFDVSKDDLSIELLKNILGRSAFGETSNSTSLNEQMLANAFGLLNAGMLIFGSALFAYASIMGSIKTATDGEFLGKKWSSIWVPVRFAVGSMLLFPTIAGYSIAQMAVLTFAMQGVGVASAVWGGAVSAFTEGGTGIMKPELASDATMRNLALNVFKSDLCVADLNARRTANDSTYSFHSSDPDYLTWGADTGVIAGAAERVAKFLDESKHLTKSVCGEMAITPGDAEDFRKAQHAAVVAIHNSFIDSDLPARMTKRFELDAEGTSVVAVQEFTEVTVEEFGRAIEAGKVAYATRIKPASDALVANYTRVNADFVKESKAQGWITAGVWYYQMARLSSDIAETTKYVGIFKPSDNRSGLSADVEHVYSELTKRYLDELSKSNRQSTKKTFTVNSVGGTMDAVDVGVKRDGFAGTLRLTGIGGATKSFAESFGYDVDNTAHPIVQLKNVGDYMMSTIESMYAIYEVGSFVTERAGGFSKAISVAKGFGVIDSAKNLVNPMFYLVTASIISMFVFACILSLYLPMVPFILWMGSVFGWITSVFETMVAVPIWIAAHLHPEGEDMAGKWGANGYMLVLEIFARPVLMVFGLIGAFVICEPFMRLLTSAFWNAAGSIQSESIHGLVSMTVIICIFVTMCGTFMNRLFSLIHVVPNSVMRWVGGHPSGHDKAEQDQSQIQGGVQRTAGGMGSAMQHSKTAQNKLALEKKRSAAEAAASANGAAAGSSE